MKGREPCWRVLVAELNSAVEEEKGGGEKAPRYLISPYGARMSRVLVVGGLSPAESVGRPDAAPFFRAKLADPTGTVSVTAGSFQPRALIALREHAESSPALVVGKVNLYRATSGTAYVSIRAEALQRIAEESYRALLLEAVGQTLERIRLMRRLRSEPRSNDATLTTEGIPAMWIRGARAAHVRYPQPEPPVIGPAIAEALTFLRSQPHVSAPLREVGPGPSIRITRISPAPARPVQSTADLADASAFLDLIDDLAGESIDGYADVREAMERAAVRGVSEKRAEELLNRLEEEGVLEEPIVGKLRRA